MRRHPVILAVIVSILAAPQYAEGLTVINLPTSSFGTSSYIDMSQSITVPTSSDTQLDSFQFYGLGSGLNIRFQTLVYQYDPATMMTVGDPLFASIPQIASYHQTFVFNTGGLLLTAGGHYLIDLHQQDFDNNGCLQMDYSNTLYSGGDLLRGPYSGGWEKAGFPQSLAFQAVFSNVPEPASLTLLVVGAAGLLVRRRRVAGA